MLAKRFLVPIASAIMLAVVLPAAPASAGPRPDADSFEEYFPSSDGITTLHADVLRPKGLAIDVKTPVILSVSPYMNHAGGPVGTTNPYSPTTLSGPSARFYDFLDLSGALTKGYTFVTVDLPGTGGSSGCTDWGGVREQGAVRAAVEWAASRSWSTGKVALLGKSYDGWTGLMGVATQPVGLAAVVALEPVYDGYRYIWNNGIRRSATVATNAVFQVNDASPGATSDTPMYHANGAPQAWCYGLNVGGAALDDNPHGPFWEERNLVDDALGKTTPVFLTQGLLETNTLQDGAFQYLNRLSGTDNRAWIGQFDHARAWEKNNSGSTPAGNNSRWQTGRPGTEFIDEVMRFLDEHLKGIKPAVEDPAIEVQDFQGRWRTEESYPPKDSHLYETSLTTGTYADDGSGAGFKPTATQGLWTVSQPLPHDVWLAGEPVITAGVEGVPNANFAANVYDIDEDGAMLMISRGGSLIRGTGRRTVSYTMFGQDWRIPAGHRIGVLVSDADTTLFQHVPTGGNVTVLSAKIGLPFLTYDRTEFLPSEGTTPRLENFTAAGGAILPSAKIDSSQKEFTLPGPLKPDPDEQ